MKKMVITIAALAALSAGPAWAADMAVKVPYKAPYSWTGCYAGFNFGFFQALDRYDNIPSGATVPAAGVAVNATSYTDHGSAYDAGGQLGCDYQFSNVVVGIVVDGNGTALNESILATQPANAFLLDKTETVSKRVGWFATARARAGVTPWEGWLFYATGGFAIAGLKGEYSAVFSDGTAFAGSSSVTRTGWTAGAGVEWMVAQQWTMNFEYLYLDFGSFSFLSPNTSVAGGAANPAFSWTTNVRAREQTFRVGINYHFGGPVIAKY
jgi:outer membrane immunogenic protein